ncbi:MAG: alpha/beta hydrolase [bacterium]
MPLFGASGERIGYEIYPHPEAAPPLVLIHGFTASKASFEANLAGLRQHFTVITVELLGHGDSDAPADAIFYRPERAIRRLLQLFDHLGYQRLMVCGHSLGGALALRLALDAPEWVAGLVVINSSSAAGDPAWRDAARPRMEEMGARLRAEGTAFMKTTRLYPAHSKRLDPLSREMLTRDFDRAAAVGFAGTAESLVVDVNAWERHPVLSVPMLLVVGERDGDFAPNAEAFLERFPPDLTRMVRLPNAGHAANIEQPQEFDDAVVQFARDIAYLPLATAAVGGNNRMLTALGGSLVLAGLGLLAAAVIFSGGNDKKGDDGTALAAAPATIEATRTQSPVAGVAGTRITGPAQTVPPGANATVTTAVASATAVPATSTVAATATRAAATEAPTATPEATSTPTTLPATATAIATATPSGPHAAISGPSSAAVGEVVVLSDGSSPASLTRRWVLPSGTNNGDSGVSFKANSPGCYTVTMTAYFQNVSQPQTVAKVISVGGAACN